MIEKLKPCPFCGKRETVKYTDCIDLEACANFDNCKYACQFTVVCDCTEGGCGATSGWASTKEKAATKWNTRVEKRFPACFLPRMRRKGGETVVGEGANGEYYGFECSKCGFRSIIDPGYCPHCGAKVVEQ